MYTKDNFSLLHRILHWLIAFGILLILLTVFLRMNWMNKNSVGEIIYTSLQEKDINFSREEAIKIAKKIRTPMFNWHVYIGYTVFGLFILRLFYMIVKGSQFKSPFSKNLSIKQKIQSSIYILFYILMGITLITGVFIEIGNLSTEYKKPLKEIHAYSLYFMLSFLVIHFIGIFIGEKSTDKGIVSAMINGGRENHSKCNSNASDKQ